PLARLAGASVSTAIVANAPQSMARQVCHLVFPPVGMKRPRCHKNDCPALTPISKEQARAVCCLDKLAAPAFLSLSVGFFSGSRVLRAANGKHPRTCRHCHN